MADSNKPKLFVVPIELDLILLLHNCHRKMNLTSALVALNVK